MADLSGYTAVFVRTTGNDNTGDGSSLLPYATVQKAFEAALGLPGNRVIDIDSGTFAGVNLQTAGSFAWPGRIAIRGVSAGASIFGGIVGDGNNETPTTNLSSGLDISIVSDKTVSIGNISTVGGYDTESNAVPAGFGGNVTLTDCVVGTITTDGGEGVDSYATNGVAGNAGNITLANTSAGDMSARGGDGNSGYGGNGGNVIVNTRSATGTIDNPGGDGEIAPGNGGQTTVTDSVCGDINSIGGAGLGTPGSTGTATFVGYAKVPDLVLAYTNASALKQGRGVNGSGILGIV